MRTYSTSYRAVRVREQRAKRKAELIALGLWVDKRKLVADKPEQQSKRSFYVARWRAANRERARLSDRVYKGMKRNPYYLFAWPLIVRYYGGCVKCGATENICHDHILSVLDAPDTRNCLLNLQPLCRTCNGLKHGSTDDYRHDHGAWIKATFRDYSSALHPVDGRSRIPIPDDVQPADSGVPCYNARWTLEHPPTAGDEMSKHIIESRASLGLDNYVRQGEK